MILHRWCHFDLCRRKDLYVEWFEHFRPKGVTKNSTDFRHDVVWRREDDVERSDSRIDFSTIRENLSTPKSNKFLFNNQFAWWLFQKIVFTHTKHFYFRTWYLILDVVVNFSSICLHGHNTNLNCFLFLFVQKWRHTILDHQIDTPPLIDTPLVLKLIIVITGALTPSLEAVKSFMDEP